MPEALTPREIVRRCIAFRDPPRIGRHFATDPIRGRIWEDTDFAGAGYAADPRFTPEPGQTEWVTEWGVRRRTLGTQIGEAVGFPLAEGWHLLDTYRFPDFSPEWRWTELQTRVARGHAAGKYVYGSVPSLMLLPIDLRGIENWFMDNAAEQENLGRLLDRLVDIRATMIEKYAAAGVDAVITYDDMGSNDRPLVSPATFRELYFPRYKATIDQLHEHGMHFIHHCCGQVREYMDMFVEAELDVLQLDQPTLMGIEWLGKHYGGKLCFWNPVDIQTTLGSGDLDAIEEEARRQIWHLGNYGGGFMVKAYQQPESIGMTIAQAQRQYDAFRRWGNYPLRTPENVTQ
ncbi:MAG: hypothetical protein K9N49_04665 [Candidatus Marinimicrobia bacterium]|nr:hypothetical protein [Candidatus Neomarinimicrobiota bacterium]